MVLGYLAYETLGRLVELCLLVRRDASRYDFTYGQNLQTVENGGKTKSCDKSFNIGQKFIMKKKIIEKLYF